MRIKWSKYYSPSGDTLWLHFRVGKRSITWLANFRPVMDYETMEPKYYRISVQVIEYLEGFAVTSYAKDLGVTKCMTIRKIPHGFGDITFDWVGGLLYLGTHDIEDLRTPSRRILNRVLKMIEEIEV